VNDLSEVDQLILESMEEGIAIAVLNDDGELIFYHIEHTDDEMLKNALSIEEVERLMRNKEAE